MRNLSVRFGIGRRLTLLVLGLVTLVSGRGAALQTPLLLHGRRLEFQADNLINHCSADSLALDDSSVTKIADALDPLHDSASAFRFSGNSQDSLRRWADSARRMLLLARQRDDNDLAVRYAPILRFAPGERMFPTLPFYSAFDSSGTPQPIDTLMNWVLPFDSMRSDSSTYAWAQVGKDRGIRIRRRVRHEIVWARRPSLAYLRRKYLGSLQRSSVQSARPVAAVLYRICDLPDARQAPAHRRLAQSLFGVPQEPPPETPVPNQLSDVWQYLKGDEQAWRRSGLDTLVSPANAAPGSRAATGSCARLTEATPMRVVQYFLYYLADRGLEGHPHDLESVFVFVPREPGLARCLRIVVGAGHKDPAPNNVLVFVGDEANKPRFEQQSVLVEFGGHSSAPDLPPFGQFSAGLDVNWHVDELWGTRDKQASAGVEYHGRYEGGMTYPRDQDDAVTMLPDALDSTSRELLEPLVRLPQARLASKILEYYRDTLALDTFALDTLAISRLKSEHFEIMLRLANQELEDLTDRILSHYQSITRAWQGYARPHGDSLFLSQRGDSTLNDSALTDLRSEALTDLLASIRSPRISQPEKAAAELSALLHTAADKGAAFGPQGVTLRSSIKHRLRRYVPPPEQVDTLKTLVKMLQQETNARLMPRYSLVPIEHLRRLYQSARESDTLRSDSSRTAQADTASKYFRLVVLSLHPRWCPVQHQPGCDLMAKDRMEFARLFRGYAGCGKAYDVGCLVNQAGIERKATLARLVAAWDTGGLWDTRGRRKSAYRISDKKLYKPWAHALYHSPTDIFRPHLFRPNTIQTKGDFTRLFTFGLTITPRAAARPHLGLIIPAIPGLPAKVPGYLEVQVGPYLSWPGHGGTRMSFAGSVLYDSRWAYFWGWFVKGTVITSRDHVERRDDATWFTLSAGPTFWLPFGMLKPLHIRTGLRFDVHRWTPTLATAGWEVEFDLHH